MDLIVGFACGIATSYLIQYLKNLKNDKLRAGEEEICKSCCYKSAVMETISDVQADN